MWVHVVRSGWSSAPTFPSAKLFFEVAKMRFSELAAQPHDAARQGAVEAWDDGAAAFNDGESPGCLAYRLCRASSAGFDSGRALEAGGVFGVGGGSGCRGGSLFLNKHTSF